MSASSFSLRQLEDLTTHCSTNIHSIMDTSAAQVFLCSLVESQWAEQGRRRSKRQQKSAQVADGGIGGHSRASVLAC